MNINSILLIPAMGLLLGIVSIGLYHYSKPWFRHSDNALIQKCIDERLYCTIEINEYHGVRYSISLGDISKYRIKDPKEAIDFIDTFKKFNK